MRGAQHRSPRDQTPKHSAFSLSPRPPSSPRSRLPRHKLQQARPTPPLSLLEPATVQPRAPGWTHAASPSLRPVKLVTRPSLGLENDSLSIERIKIKVTRADARFVTRRGFGRRRAARRNRTRGGLFGAKADQGACICFSDMIRDCCLLGTSAQPGKCVVSWAIRRVRRIWLHTSLDPEWASQGKERRVLVELVVPWIRARA